MDQERNMTQITTNAKVVGETLLKLLWLAGNDGKNKITQRRENQVFVGQIPWQKFMATKGTKEVRTFMTSEVNLDKVKKEMEAMGVGFAFHYNADKTQVTMAFNAKDQAFIRDAFEKVVKDVVKDPKGMTERYKMKPENMKPEDKIKLYQPKVKEAGLASALEKATEKVGRSR